MAPDINPSLPQTGQPNASEEPKIVTALSQLVATVNNIDTANLADGAVTSAKIADALVTSSKLADGAVTSAKIADGTIAAGDLAASAKVAIRQVFDLHAGPLPINGSFTTQGGPILIIMAGSGYAPSGAAVVGFDFKLDGANYQGSHIFLDTVNLHVPTVPRFAFFGALGAGAHTLQFYGVGMATDASDRFNCTVVELVP